MATNPKERLEKVKGNFRRKAKGDLYNPGMKKQKAEKDPRAVAIGQAIRKARRALNMTQPALGKECGVTGSAVSQWELGGTAPERHHWATLDRLLSVKVSAFYSECCSDMALNAVTESSTEGEAGLLRYLAGRVDELTKDVHRLEHQMDDLRKEISAHKTDPMSDRKTS